MSPMDSPKRKSEDEVEANEEGADDQYEFAMEDSDGYDIDNDDLVMVEENNVVDMAVITFKEHTDSLFTCCLDKEGHIAVTGGQDDQALVWDTTNGQLLFKCSDFQDSIVTVALSHDEKYLACGDYSGCIQVYKMSAKEKVWEFTTSGDLNFMFFHHSTNILFAGTEAGEMWMWLIPAGMNKLFDNKGTPVQLAKVMHNGKRIITAYADGRVRIFDLKSLEEIHNFIPPDSNLPIAIDCNKEDTLAVIGYENGASHLFNCNNGKILSELTPKKVSDNIPIEDDDGQEEDLSEFSIEVASFCPVRSEYVVTCTQGGHLRIYDLNSTHKLRCELDIESCLSSIVWDPVEPIVYIPGLDGVIRKIHLLEGKVKTEYTGHTDKIFSLSINKDGKRLLSCSDDKTAKLFLI